ncbi:acyl-CoA dehydrogenase [Celeribacter arenosi]|uniref:Acyl-CoA dehydrogenase n=1 Tax=Celeribacter arenosi TaxID=792649 RepID=A0ABP7K0C5_9RHOB
MPYRAPVEDIRFVLDHIAPFGAVVGSPQFPDLDRDTAMAVIEEAGRLASDVIAPIDRAGDLNPARLENGKVKSSPGFADAYTQIAEGGWMGMLAGEEHGGMALPLTLATAVNEMMSGACLSLALNPLMSQGQIEALENHASDELKSLYLPKLISGEWCGTMNLTESGAGSDVGALRTKAEPNGDGTYAITGQKIFITWGDSDFSKNICHLVLARLPDGQEGTKGISLFMVPKYLLDENGEPGEENTLRVVSLEHKLGIHGSPTCVMEYEGATGWLVGEEHSGMKAMFTMMNNARLGVGVQGVGIAEAATQKALGYACDRVQGRSPVADGTGAIVDHADVRRMLAAMRADTFVARAISLSCAVALDRGRSEPDQAARGAFLIPVAKAFSTDIGHEIAQSGVQVHGGMGYIEETGAAQYARDARITSIYEGTNGIQAMDFVGRKLMDGGDAAFGLLDEIEAFAENVRGELPELAEPVWSAAETLREAVEGMLSLDMNDRFGCAVPYLRAFARVLGGYFHLKAAKADPNRARLAAFYIHRVLPEFAGLLAQTKRGSADLYAITLDDLAAG